MGQVGRCCLLAAGYVPDRRRQAGVGVAAQRVRYLRGRADGGHRLGQGLRVVQALPEPAADHRAGRVRGISGQRDPPVGQSCWFVVHDRGAEYSPGLQRQGQRLPPRAGPPRRGEVGQALPDRAGQRAGRQAAVHGLAVEQPRLVQQLALLGVIPDHVQPPVPDRGLAARPGDRVGHQPVRAGVHLAGRLTRPGQRDVRWHGPLIDQGAPEQHPGVAGVGVGRIHRGADCAAGAVGADHQIGGERFALCRADRRVAVRVPRRHGDHVPAAQHAYAGQARRVLLQPALQQVPRGAVTVDPGQHRRVRVEAGDLAEQGHVDAQPAAAIDGLRGAALGHRHLESQPGQGDRGREADQAAADHHASDGPAGGGGLGHEEPLPAGVRAGTSLRYWWTDWMTDEPSPTAAATRFIDPARISPAAKIPSTAVS